MAVRGSPQEVSGNSRTDLLPRTIDRFPVTTLPPSDAIVVGGGLVGLCCAAALARDGATVILLDEVRPGAASAAAGGMLAPSLDRGNGPATDFALAARDRYPGYLEWLEDATGVAVPLNRDGVLQVAVTDAGVRGLRRAMRREADPDAEWLDAPALHALEPALSHALGAVLHPRDGAVDNVTLLTALAAYCRSTAAIRLVDAAVERIVIENGTVAVVAGDGRPYHADHVVVAGGAWAPAIEGLPQALPVTPLRGQMLAFSGAAVGHVVFGPRGYLVPRSASAARATAETVAGSTSEQVGFDPGMTPAAARSMHDAAAEILPALGRALPIRQWAGLRPMTPDLQPIIGRDPEVPALLYACGHSRNGVLLAPLTADCISRMVRGHPEPHDLQPFSVDRFSRR